jgi:UPF0716 family protein affecting phage T7 exclusion
MTSLVKRLARWTAAVILFVVGLVLSLPGVPGPGFVVILLGVFVLLPESRWLRKKYVRFKRRHPRLFHFIESRRARRRRWRYAHLERRRAREERRRREAAAASAETRAMPG